MTDDTVRPAPSTLGTFTVYWHPALADAWVDRRREARDTSATFALHDTGTRDPVADVTVTADGLLAVRLLTYYADYARMPRDLGTVPDAAAARALVETVPVPAF